MATKPDYQNVERINVAPDMDEIRREGNVFLCHFNGMDIKWCIGDDCSDMDEQTERALKEWLQSAIGMSGKLWQVPFVLNKELPFPSIVYVNGKVQDYPSIERER